MTDKPVNQVSQSRLPSWHGEAKTINIAAVAEVIAVGASSWTGRLFPPIRTADGRSNQNSNPERDCHRDQRLRFDLGAHAPCGAIAIGGASLHRLAAAFAETFDQVI
jgi:hypothetical protein